MALSGGRSKQGGKLASFFILYIKKGKKKFKEFKELNLGKLKKWLHIFKGFFLPNNLIDGLKKFSFNF